MGFISKRYRNSTGVPLSDVQNMLSILGIDETTINQEKFGETIYFICLNHLVQTNAKMPRHKYIEDEKGKERIKDFLEYVLNREPNPIYTASTLWSSVELNRLHYGNAYVYIENQGKNTYLWVLPSEQVQIYIDNAGVFDYGINNSARSKLNPIWYVWEDNRSGKRYTFNSSEVLHYKTHISVDGLTGLAVKDILKQQLESLKYSQSYQSNLFKNNMFGGKIILQYTGDLNTAGKDTLIKNTERYANSVGTGKFLPIPMGITATQMDMKLSDAEFTELNKLNSLQIAACFGIKPNVINDYSKSSYSNSETQQLDFYVNSLQAIFKMYSDEDTRKLLTQKEKSNGTFIDIDKEILFELNKTALMDILVKGVNNFLITPQEGRKKLGYSYIEDENANKLYGNANLAPIDVAGKGLVYSKGGGQDNGQQT